MSSFNTGREAENEAALYLADHGYEIIDRNWRTRYCEIDLIAKKSNTVYFVEVKYRRNSNYGSGLDSIDKKKLARMQFAAEVWISAQDRQYDYQLAAIAVDHTGVTDFIDSVVL